MRQSLRNGEGITLELYAFERPVPIGPRERRKNNMYGLTHLAFYVDSVDDVGMSAGFCQAAGGKTFPHTRATFRDNGTTMMYCTDPDGTRVELMQAPGERQRFSHSGVCMADVEGSLTFYQGLRRVRAIRENYWKLYDHTALAFMNVVNELNDVKLRAQMIRNGRGDTIELLHMKSPAAFGPREPLPVNQYGFNYPQHSRTDNIDTAAAQVRAAWAGADVRGNMQARMNEKFKIMILRRSDRRAVGLDPAEIGRLTTWRAPTVSRTGCRN